MMPPCSPPDLLIQRQEDRPQGLHQEDLARLRQIGQRHGLGAARREGLFAQDGFAGRKACPRIQAVAVVRCGDADGADGRIGEQVAQVGLHPRTGRMASK